MKDNNKFRKVKRYKNYFNDFFEEQSINIKKKILWTLEVIEELERVPETYLKHLTGTEGLYEIRVKFGTNIFRIFCFFDKGNLVILMNGFQKKSQKTPQRLIDKALKIKKDYENEQ